MVAADAEYPAGFSITAVVVDDTSAADAAVFAAATNTFWAPILIGCEVFGYALMPYLMIVVIISYMLNFNKSIYTAQDMLQNMFEAKKKD